MRVASVLLALVTSVQSESNRVTQLCRIGCSPHLAVACEDLHVVRGALLPAWLAPRLRRSGRGGLRGAPATRSPVSSRLGVR